MSAPPGGSFLPFMTSVTTDIYERIEKLTHSLSEIGELIKNTILGIEENFNKIVKSIQEMVEQGEMNKEMTLQAFADSMNTLIQQIRSIRDENIRGFQNAQTQQMIDAANNTALMLEARMSDIQIAFLISGLHALMNAIKTGKVVGIPVPTAGAPAPAASQAGGAQIAAPIPSMKAKGEKKSFFGKGARKKTHDEIMEEKRKKDAMFRKFLR